MKHFPVKFASTPDVTEVACSGYDCDIFQTNTGFYLHLHTLNSFFSSQVEFLSEADKMKLLSHPNVVKLLGVCTTGEPVYIIMELMIHGENLNDNDFDVCIITVCWFKIH